MTDWPAFAGFAGVVLAALLLLARMSQGAVGGDGATAADPDDRPTPAVDRDRATPFDRPERPRRPGSPDDRIRRDDGVPVEPPATDDAEDGTEATSPADPEPTPVERSDPTTGGVGGATPAGPSTGVLLANVALSQGALGTLLLAGAWYTGVPAAALGAGPSGLGTDALAAGAVLGAALYAANEAGAAVGRRVGFGGGEELRRALAPGSTAGWAVLLLVVLPVIAGFEELLFRGVLVGALGAGFGVSPWLLAALSSLAFAAGHGAQGRVGVVVTGTLGFVLAAAFVITGSLLAVVVAHYLVNALEFLVHEWAGIDPGIDGWRAR
ncbi:MAG: type II CAAX prenyl endopeptidase Rce1 family protein [Haloferacaceae archaeon]